MVQRYRFNYVQEMFETETGEQHNETERGEWVKYEDYADLEKLLAWVCLNFNLYDLPPCEQRNKLEEMGLL